MPRIVFFLYAVSIVGVVVFLFYRHLNRLPTSAFPKKSGNSGLSPVESAKFAFEEFNREHLTMLASITRNIKNATSVEQKELLQKQHADLLIDEGLDIANRKREIYDEFGIVMLPPPRDFDILTDSIHNMEFTWRPCPKDGKLSECLKDHRTERGGFL